MTLSATKSELATSCTHIYRAHFAI